MTKNGAHFSKWAIPEVFRKSLISMKIQDCLLSMLKNQGGFLRINPGGHKSKKSRPGGSVVVKIQRVSKNYSAGGKSRGQPSKK